MSHPTSGGNYGIKLIYAEHMLYEHFVRPCGDDRPALMNFKRDAKGIAVARRIPTGHRALLYVVDNQLFCAAFEFIGSVEDGERARKAHGIEAKASYPFTVYRPIRFIARVEPWERGIHRHLLIGTTGLDFESGQGDTHHDLSQAEFERAYQGIPWTWQERSEATRS